MGSGILKFRNRELWITGSDQFKVRYKQRMFPVYPFPTKSNSIANDVLRPKNV
jgi:hypothetical protein